MQKFSSTEVFLYSYFASPDNVGCTALGPTTGTSFTSSYWPWIWSSFSKQNLHQPSWSVPHGGWVRHALPPGLPPHCSWSVLLCAAVLHSEHIKHKPALRQLCTCNYNRWRKHWSFVHCMRYIIYSTLNAIVMKWVLGRMLFASH